MSQVKAPDAEEMIELKCPFCEGLWDFVLNDSYKMAQLVFICQNCNKKIFVSQYK